MSAVLNEPRRPRVIHTELELCPLARRYRWTSPIQDWSPQTAPLGSADRAPLPAPPPLRVVTNHRNLHLPVSVRRSWKRTPPEVWARFCSAYDALPRSAAGRVARGAYKALCVRFGVRATTGTQALSRREKRP